MAIFFQTAIGVIQLFPCSTQVSMSYIRLLNVKCQQHLLAGLMQHLRVLKQEIFIFSEF